MTPENEIQSRVDKLDVRQRCLYDNLIAEGEPNPFATMNGIRDRLAAAEVMPEERPAAILALTALTAQVSNRIERKFETDEEAVANVQQQIAQAREAGDDQKADMMQATLDRVETKQQAESERIEAVQQAQIDRMLQAQDDLIEEYKSRYAELKQAKISELTIQGRMEQEAAEQMFEQLHRPNLELGLKRQMGL